MQHLKARPDDLAARSSLEFILSALNALKAKNPLAESFLVQLEVDLEGMGFQGARTKTDIPFPRYKEVRPPCLLLFDLDIIVDFSLPSHFATILWIAPH